MKDSQSGITAKYFYDFVNRLERYTRSGAAITLDVGYTYDSEDRVTQVDALIHQYTRTSTYTYDDDNRVTASTAVNSSTAYTYDDFGRLIGRVNSHAGSAVLRTTLGYRNPTNTTTTGQISSLTLDAASYDKTLSYTYSVNGNILSVIDGSKTTSYVYDTAGQLLRENNQAAGKTWVWTYDNGGNLLTRKEYAYTTGTLGSVLDTVTYTYGNSNWGDLLTKYDGQTITYDAIGNPLTDGTWTYTWEHGRQLKSMTDGTTTWTYGYDSDGMRYSRSDGTTTWQYIYIGDQLAYMQGDGNYMYFQYDANGTPVSVAHNGTYYYYVTNLQGDVIALLNTSGAAVVEYTYDAWGKPLTITGSKASTIGAVNPMRYRGYVYDTETGLYYVSSRYYDPEIGRFINADILVATGQGLLGNNMYAYCRNNPVCRYDVTGYADSDIEEKYDDDTEVTPHPNELGYGGGSNGGNGGTVSSSGSSYGGTSQPISTAPSGTNSIAGGTTKVEKTETHHIVERCQASKSGFSQEKIEGDSNKVDIPYSVHRKVSGYYSSIQSFSNGMRVRDWLAGQSFEFQTSFGWKVLEEIWELLYGVYDDE